MKRVLTILFLISAIQPFAQSPIAHNHGYWYVPTAITACGTEYTDVVGGADGSGCTNAGNIVTSGMKLWLDATNSSSYGGSGTTWTDLSGNANHATLVGGTNYQNDAAGKYMQLGLLGGSAGRYIDVTNNEDTRLNNSIQTLQMWLWIDNLWQPNGNDYFEAWYSGVQFHKEKNIQVLRNKIQFQHSSTVSGGYLFSSVSCYIPLGTWVNLVFVLDATNSLFKVYKNGIYQGQTSVSSTLKPAEGGAGSFVRIGDYRGTVNDRDYGRGRVSWVALYNRELTLAEIQQNYNNTKGCWTETPDADAASFITTAGITDTKFKNELHTVVRNLKTLGYWTSKFTAIYPFAQCTETQHSYNLRNTATYQLAYTGSPSHDVFGMDLNGTSQYAATGINPSTVLTANSTHMSVWLLDNTSEDGVDMGSADGSGNRLTIQARTSTGNFITDHYSTTDRVSAGSAGNSNSSYITNRTSSTNLIAYRGASQIGTTVSAGATSSLPNAGIYLGALNNNGTAANFSTRKITMASVGVGLTDTERRWVTSVFYNYLAQVGRGNPMLLQ